MPAGVTKLARGGTRPPRLASSGPCAGAAASLLLLFAACADERSGTPPENLVLVTVDTLRADRLSAYGHDRATSDLTGYRAQNGEPPPGMRSLDQLAEEGVVFSRAFAPRGMTFPSVATLFTGRSPLEHGALENEDLLCDALPTLATELSRAGFDTAAFTANPLLSRESGIARGFDHFLMDRSPDRDLRVVQAATAWLLERDLERGPPFFVWVHLMGPHMPYDPQPLDGVDYASLFTDPAYRGAADGSRAFLDAAYRDGVVLEARDVEHVRALYDGEVARVDHLVASFAQVLAGELDAQPVDLLAETLFVFTADHGEELHQRNGYWAHSKSVYDSVLHVPLLLRHPNSLTGRRAFGELVELQDLMPTLLEWFGLPVPSGVAGRSLLPLVDGEDFESRPALGTWEDRVFSVRTPEWRYVWNPDGVEPDDPPAGAYPIPAAALFDHDRDPREFTDVAERHPDVVAELERAIERWREELEVVCLPDGTVSPQRAADLEALGYAEGGDESAREEAE